eukprot:493916_1
METKEDTRGLNDCLIGSKLMNFMSLGVGFVEGVFAGKEGRILQPMEKDQMWDILRETLKSGNRDGPEPSEVFSEFDDKPMKSSLIHGQAHRARIRKSGKEVVVKIVNPTMERLAGLNTISPTKKMEAMFNPEQQQLVMKVLKERQFYEVNYREEAESLCTIRDGMLDGGFEGEIVIPRPLWEYTTETTLCMDLLEGKTLRDICKSFLAKIAASKGKVTKAPKFDFNMISTGKFGPDRYMGPSARSISAYCLALIVADWCINLPRHCINLFLWLAGLERWALPLRHTELPPNVPRIMDVLMRAMAHQILVDKYFHGDLHGGNMMLLKDGRLGLIDMGRTETISEDEAENWCHLYLRMKAGDNAGVKEVAVRMGYRSKNLDEDVIYDLLRFFLDSNGPEVIGKDKNHQQFIENLFKRDPWTKFSNNFNKVVQAVIMLRGIGRSLGHPVAVADWMAPVAKKELENIRIRKAEKNHLCHAGRDTAGVSQ